MNLRGLFRSEQCREKIVVLFALAFKFPKNP